MDINDDYVRVQRIFPHSVKMHAGAPNPDCRAVPAGAPQGTSSAYGVWVPGLIAVAVVLAARPVGAARSIPCPPHLKIPDNGVDGGGLTGAGSARDD